jgi:hypothetical protein
LFSFSFDTPHRDSNETFHHHNNDDNDEDHGVSSSRWVAVITTPTTTTEKQQQQQQSPPVHLYHHPALLLQGFDCPIDRTKPGHLRASIVIVPKRYSQQLESSKEWSDHCLGHGQWMARSCTMDLHHYQLVECQWCQNAFGIGISMYSGPSQGSLFPHTEPTTMDESSRFHTHHGGHGRGNALV